MQWSQPIEPPAAARSMGPSIVAQALGLDEQALDEALAWARRRTSELLRTVDDRELLALLDPPGTRATMELPVAVEPREPPRRRATLELPAITADAAEDLYDLAQLDAVELPELEWEGEPLRAPPEPEPWERAETVARVRRLRARPRSPDPDRSGPTRAAKPAAASAEPVEPRVVPRPKPRPASTTPERRTSPRCSLVEPAVIEIERWADLVTLYTRDISCGGMFVHSPSPPPRDSEVRVSLLLPDDAGTLDFDGVVVHVVTSRQAAASGTTAGFGLQFRGLTPERRRALQRIVDQAQAAADSPHAATPRLQELGLNSAPGAGGGLRLTLSEAERRHMQQLRAELASMGSRGDLEVLGLDAEAAPEQLRAAFERLARRWHPSVAHRDAPPEIRKLATEIFLRIERAYQRLSTAPRPEPAPVEAPVPPPPAFSNDGPRPETVIGPAPTAPPSRSAPRSASVPPRMKQARRRLGKIVDRGERLASRLSRREPSVPTREPSVPARRPRLSPVDDALELISAKRYAEAVQRLEQVIADRPQPRLRVLLNVVRARQAIKERDLPRARACYEAALKLDPNNALAERELLMLCAVGA